MKTDPFGKAYYDYYHGIKKKFVIRRDDGYLDTETIETYFSPYEKWANCEKEAMKYVHGKVLDVGCGVGRHILYLQNKGYDTTGIDISTLAIKVAKMRGVKKCIVGSISNLPFNKPIFDTVLFMCNNFGLAGGYRSTAKMLRKIHQITKKGGTIVATLRDPRVTQNKAHLAYHKRNRERGWPIGLVKIRHEYNDEIGDWFYLLMPTEKELLQLATQTGWFIKRYLRSSDGYNMAILRKMHDLRKC